MEEKKEGSYFDGGFWHFVGLCLGGFLVCLITLGIAFPWVNCWFIRWRINHTVVDGKRLQFNGTGMSLFGHYILRGWLLGIILTPLTLGLYTIYYFQVSLKKWEVKNTSFIASDCAKSESEGIYVQKSISKKQFFLLISVIIGVLIILSVTIPVIVVNLQSAQAKQQNGLIAEQEFYDLADLASSAGLLSFMDETFNGIIQDALKRCVVLEGVIISGPNGEVGFEKVKGEAIIWVNNSPQFKKSKKFSKEILYQPLRIQGMQNVNIQAVARK